MRGWNIVLAGVLGCCAMGIQAQTQAVKTAGESMKNVRVLKDVPVTEWDDTMWFISASLGVGCGHCHAEGGYEKDDRKPKQTARSMIQMMREINAKNFDGRRAITCYSCHQGSLKPKVSTALWSKTPEEIAEIKKKQQQGVVSAAPKEPAALPDAEQVLADYRKAVAGEGVKTLHMKATVNFDTRPPADLEMDLGLPDSLLQHAVVGGVELRQAFQVDHGWSSVAGRIVDMGAANLDGIRKQIGLFGPLKLAAAEAPRKTSALEKIDGKAFFVVESRSATHLDRLYFAVETGLLYKQYRETYTSLGDVLNETILEDYRDVSGAKLPFQIITRVPTERARYVFSEIEVNRPIDPARFERPKEGAGGK